MTESRLQRIQELLESVDSIEDLSRRLERPEERELLKRVSLLRYFNETIFNTYLRKHLPESAPDFKTFTSDVNIEPVPRTQRIYAIREEARQHYLGLLLADKASNSESWKNATAVFADLLRYYKGDDPIFALERMVLLIVVNPAKATETFEDLYTEADSRFDLARCNDVLGAVELRLKVASPDLYASWDKRRQYYNSRHLYLSDFYQTNTYYSQEVKSLNLDSFFHRAAPDAKQWIFHVYATGGLGKTMFVRWLISRYCLPEPRRIPVARLDFDLLNLNYISLHPLLLLLPIAEQLNQQIEKRPFSEKFNRLWRFMPLLDRETPGSDRTALEASFEAFESSWNQTALQEFCLAFSDAQFTGPIVIAIDTLEEMLFFNRDSLSAVIRQIQQMHDSYKSLRLVLSGRYDLRKELTDLGRLLHDEAISHELHRFTTTEARSYLTEKRGLSDEAYIEAIIEKCANKEEKTINPFVLSLMTDLVSSKEIKTVEEIAKYPRAEVAYMIQRIIDRIKDYEIRWILRYAVVPRVLTLDVLEGVLWKHLVAEREKERGLDSRRGREGDFDQTEYWPYGEASTPAEAWEKLKPFVATRGWISSDNRDPGQLKLHSDVIVPMRYLLATEEITRRLHRDAMRYFAERAEKEGARVDVWLAESLYHRFQCEGPATAGYWRKQLAKHPILQSNMEARRRYANEITTRDYVDEEGVPIKWPNEESATDIVALEDLCTAHEEAAAACIVLAARYKQTTSHYRAEWNQAREHLLRLRTLLCSPNNDDVRPGFDVYQYLELADHLKNISLDYTRVLPLMEKALEETHSIFISVALRIQLAEMYSALGYREAGYHFREALKAAGFLRITFLSPSRIRLKLARWYQEQKHYKEALAEYATALQETSHGSRTGRDIQRRIAAIYLDIARPNTAATLVGELIQSGRPNSSDNFENQLLFSRIMSRGLHRPRIALANVRTLIEFAPDQKGTAAVTELEGLILAQLMEFKDAAVLLERAKEQWSTLNDLRGPDRTRMYRLELQMDQIGDFKEISALLDAWQNYGNKRDPDIASKMEVLSMRYAVSQGNRSIAESLWRAAMQNQKFPSALARLLAAALVLGFGGEQTVQQLIDALDQIEPSSARLPLLSVFRFAKQGASDRLPQKYLKRLLRLIEWPVEKRDAFSTTILCADVHRFCGMNDRVNEMLVQAIDRALKQNETFALVQLLSVINRTPQSPLEPVDLHSTRFFGDYREFPGVCYVALLEQAERELNGRQLERAEFSLKSVNSFLRPDSISRWDAFAAQLNARLQMLVGDRKRATISLNNAASIYQELGDHHAAEHLREQQPAVPMDLESQQLSHLDRTWMLQYEGSQEHCLLKLIRGNDEVFTRTISASEPLRQVFGSLRDRAEILRLVGRMSQEPQNLRTEFADVLIGADIANVLRSSKLSPVDLRLELSPNQAKLPWEWIISDVSLDLEFTLRYVYRCNAADLFDNEIIKWIQVALKVLTDQDVRVDGFLGPVAQRQLDQLGLPRVRSLIDIPEQLAPQLRSHHTDSRIKALVIKPSHETRVSSMRGRTALSAPSLYSQFETAIFNVSKVERLAEELQTAVIRFQPQIIHVESSYTENPNTGDVYLDFNVLPDSYSGGGSSSPYSSEYVQISTTLLSDILDSLPVSKLRPLLVLEGQSGAGISSTIHQMFLRNTFASELFRHGKTTGVVCTGLFEDSGQRLDLLQALIDGLGHSDALSGAVDEMIQVHRGHFLRPPHDAMWLPVLFTNSPWFRLFPDPT
ncbi:MAG TPA: tetratricopeptide repeat protein [Pyrinomonadaceae bacterium]|nr:tetratricopeptide repeat protein [Pyrinomonadaceae bacterium]